jgi:putative peptidoglycan lipid II flippase
MTGKKEITRAASSFSFATILSRLLGFVRDMILARYLGASGISDAFFVAFRIPNLMRDLFAEGAMSSAFVPVLTEVNISEGSREAIRIARLTLTFILLVVGTFTIAGIILSPYIVKIIAPGFQDPDKINTTIFLTRIMFPFLLFVSLAAFTMGALNVKGTYFIPALASAWFNLTIIMTIVVITYIFHNPLIAAAIGVTIGGFMQFATQLPAYIRQGYSLAPLTGFNNPYLKKMGKLIIPVMFGQAVGQLNIFISTLLASYLSEGSITYLYYSMRLIQFPIGVFGVAMAMAVLPTLSRHASSGDIPSLRTDLSYGLRLLFYLSVPSMVGLIALRQPIISILFQRGEFTHTDTLETAYALVFYSIGIWSMVGNKVMVSAFYSLKDTKTPVKIAALALISNIFFSLMFMGPLRHGGLALANSLSSWLNFLLLFYLLRKRLHRVDGKTILKSFLKITLSSILMGIILSISANADIWTQQGRVLLKVSLLGGLISMGVIIYLIFSKIMKIGEVKDLLSAIKK